MKILFCITKSTEGGAQTHIMQLCRELTKRGHSVGVVSQSGGWLENEIKVLGGEWFSNSYFKNSYNPLRMLRAVLFIGRSIKQFKPDLVSCHSGFAGVAGRVAALGKVPVIFTAHGWSFAPGAPLVRRIITAVMEYKLSWITKKIICVSDFDRKLANRFFYGTARKLVTVHNGVETGLLNLIPHEGITITYIGRQSPQKNPELLLRTFESLPEEVRNKTRLEFIGMTVQSSVPNVFSYGSLPRTEDLTHLKQSDIFVLTSHWEGFPRSVLEAMSAGLPVIASDVGGVSEIVDESVGMVLDRKNEEEHLRNALIHFIENEDMRRECGRRARERIEQNFSLEHMYQKTFEVYKHVTNKSV